jgi:DNA topoisomerase-1
VASIAGRTKFIRLRPFGEALPGLRRYVGRQIRQPKLTRLKVAAVAVRLLDETLVRVGNEEYVRANDSYGLTTLRDKHARARGPRLELHFSGKSGKLHEIELNDRRLARLVRQCQELPGQHLFQYRDDEGNLRRLGSGDVNRLIHNATGEPFTAKDFRTWKASALLLEHLRRHDESTLSQTEARRVVSGALREAAAALGNTVTVCRNYYVHPQIVELFLAGRLADTTGSIPDRAKNRLEPYEQLLLRLMRRLERKRQPRS